MLLPAVGARAQSLDIRGAGCIGPCQSIPCCNGIVVVNESGVGLGRNVDCRRYVETASPQEKDAFCAVLLERGATCIDACQPADEPECPHDLDCPALTSQRAELLAQQSLLDVLAEDLRACEAAASRQWLQCVDRGLICVKQSCDVRDDYSATAKRLGDLYAGWIPEARALYEKCCNPNDPCIAPFRAPDPRQRSDTQNCIADCLDNEFIRCMEQSAVTCAAVTAICIEKRGKGVNSVLRCALVGETCAAAAAYRCALKAKHCNQDCREQFDDIDGCAGGGQPADASPQEDTQVGFGNITLASLGPLATLASPATVADSPSVAAATPTDSQPEPTARIPAPAVPPVADGIPVFTGATPLANAEVPLAAGLRAAIATDNGIPDDVVEQRTSGVYVLAETVTWAEIEAFYDRALPASWRHDPDMRFSRADEAIEALPAWKAWTRQDGNRGEILSIYKLTVPGLDRAFLAIEYLDVSGTQNK